MTVQSHSDLIPKWQGPYTVILLTPTTAKLLGTSEERPPWVTETQAISPAHLAAFHQVIIYRQETEKA